jgi:ribonuclease HI
MNGETLYADGGVIGVNPSRIGGTWAWRLVDAAGRVKDQASGDFLCGDINGYRAVTNNFTEFLALVNGLKALPDGWGGLVCSDSAVTLGRLFSGWKMAGIPTWLVVAGSAALQRLGPVEHLLLDGHPTRAQLAAGAGKRGNPVSEHNRWCDEECRRIALSHKDGPA